MSAIPPSALPWHRREDTWAILIALWLVFSVSGAFFLGATKLVSTAALTIPAWSDLPHFVSALRANQLAPLVLFGVFVAVFSIASSVMGGTWANTPRASACCSPSRSPSPRSARTGR